MSTPTARSKHSLSHIVRLAVACLTAALIAAACSSSDQPDNSEPDNAASQAVNVEATLCSPEVSVVRTWNEAALDAIRRDFPAPTVHARNLYHLSAVSWDAWAAYDADVASLFVEASAEANLSDDEREAARSVAISYASYRLLTHRYENATGAEASLAQFDETMDELCLSNDLDAIEANSAAGVGLAIADAVIAETLDDGSKEANGYLDDTYVPVNDPLVVIEPGAEMADPNRWQPLQLEVQITQNGLDVGTGLQEFIGPSWGKVTPFAIEPDPEQGLPIDPGPPPLFGVDDEAYMDGAIEVIRLSSLLDPTNSTMIDISPASIGPAPLGTDAVTSLPTNPATGQPYAPNLVSEADYGRVIAEYWADGPDSETPPGHWNTIANDVSDRLATTGDLRIGGEGPELGRLEWDIKLAIALNGAAHDAAIAAWGAKGFYDYVRPISIIRHFGERAELPEVAGLVETITAQSSAPGERHEALADFVGEQAVLSWRGTPEDIELDVGGVGWIRAADWLPYQRPSFVTPSFSAYVSGHSAFSRAAAEVLVAITGSEFFPGGLRFHTVDVGGLIHEAGPDDAVALQWATYYEAADEAGRSRLYGGIHVPADDLQGRELGAAVGAIAWERAQELFSS